MAVAALGTGPLAIDGLEERTVAVQCDAHLSTHLPVEVFDTPFLLEKLRLIAGLFGLLREEQGAAKALRTIAIGVVELEGRHHAEAFGAQRHAIDIAPTLGMTVLVERDGGDAVARSGPLIAVPGIEGGIGGQVGGKEAQRGDRAEVERRKVGDIAFIEGLGVLGQHDIPVDRVGAGGRARAIAEQTLLFDDFGAIGLLLICAFLTPRRQSGSPLGMWVTSKVP